ncbi:MAG: hypothetical protein AAF078_12315 [Planctomycetota bacterium]
MLLAWIGWHVVPCMATSVIGPSAAIIALMLVAEAGSWRWLAASSCIAIACSAFAVPVFWLAVPGAASHASTLFDWYSLVLIFVLSHGPAVGAVAAIVWWRRRDLPVDSPG